MFKNYLKVAFRNITRHKGYSFINITGLAIGMACCILIMLWVQDELSYDRFHENAGNLYRVAFTTENRDFHSGLLPGLAADFLKKEYPEISHATVLGKVGLKLSIEQKSLYGTGNFVHPDFFEMFTFPFANGDPKSALADPFSIVITEDLSKKLFGDSDPIGRTIKIEDSYDFKVTGVFERIPRNSHLQFDFLLSFNVAPPSMKKWDNKCTQVFLLLHKQSNYQEVTEKIWNVYNDHNPHDTKNYLYLQPITDIHLHALGGGGPIIFIYIFSIMAVLTLLIACINYMNLSTARTQNRCKEIGVKKVVGSSRMQIINQFLCESLVLSVIAIIIAIALVELIIPIVNSMFAVYLDLKYTGSILLSLIAIAFITGIVAGSYPAFFLSSFKPAAILANRFTITSKVQRREKTSWLNYSRGFLLRKILVITQFCLSIFFIVCSIIIYNQLNYLNGKDLGFNHNNIVMLNLRGETSAKSQLIKAELLQNDSIENISVSSYGLTAWGSSMGIDWEGKQSGEKFDVGYNWVDYDYLETLELEMIEGRFFSKMFATDPDDALVVNETLVKTMAMKDPIGKRITHAPGSSFEYDGKIIGIIEDYHTESLHGKIRPFILQLTENGSYMNIKIKSRNSSETLKFIERKIKEFVADDPFEYSFLNESLNRLYWSEQLLGNLIGYVTFLTVFISCMGLFGLAAFSAEQRTKEIGIRKVLGASLSNIIRLLSREFVLLIFIATLIAWPVAYLVMNRWLENFAFRTTIGIDTFLIAGLSALIITLLTVGYQAVKTALANPVDALRHE